MDTGRGGECLECGGNRAGPHCEVCQENHFISPVKDAYDRQPCLPCDCDPRGESVRHYSQLLNSVVSQAPLTSSAPLMASASVSQV